MFVRSGLPTISQQSFMSNDLFIAFLSKLVAVAVMATTGTFGNDAHNTDKLL